MSTEYKYPYIPRGYYPAVMYACKLIRENGYFNQAVKRASNYYDVDEEEVARYVRERQGAGQKGKSRKYKYYVVCGYADYKAYDGGDDIYIYDSEHYTEADYLKYAFKAVVRATSALNAKKQIQKKNELEEWDAGAGYVETGRFYMVCHIEQYDTKQDADSRHFTKDDFLKFLVEEADK